MAFVSLAECQATSMQTNHSASHSGRKGKTMDIQSEKGEIRALSLSQEAARFLETRTHLPENLTGVDGSGTDGAVLKPPVRDWPPTAAELHALVKCGLSDSAVAKRYAVARETVFNARKRLRIPSARSLGARPQRKTGVLSVREAKARIAWLRSGEQFVYYRGHLMRDRRRRSQAGRALSELADFMYRQCVPNFRNLSPSSSCAEGGMSNGTSFGTLTQRKHGAFDYEYLFTKGRSASSPAASSKR
jgi:hypothetical protein